MQTTTASTKASPFMSLLAGLLLSAGSALFFYLGISMTYNYLWEAILVLAGLIVFCSLLLWINIRYDHMMDLTDVFSKTFSFDFEFSQPAFFKVLRFLKPSFPYIGVLVTISGILFALWAVPALIMYWLLHPGPTETLLKVIVILLTAGTAIQYFLSNKDQFPSGKDRAFFAAGILIGLAGVMKVLS